MATTRYFFQASQEHFPPEDLLAQAVEAEQLGFDGIASSDHLQPWWEGGESGHTWPWLGAAGQATSTILLGTGVTPPGARYHPGLIAQAWATLERMFPGRSIREVEQLGATIVVLQNNSGADPHGAIRVYGDRVLPQLRGARVG